MRTLFVENLPPLGGEAVLERREAEHLFRVLRAAPGERFRLLDGSGGRAVAEVCPGKVLKVESLERVPEPERKLHLFFALPRRNRLDALLPACAELGAWELHPCVCARSVAESTPNERWKLQLIEGCKQSGNPFLPRVAAPEPLLPCVRKAVEGGMELFYGSVVPAETPAASAAREVGWVVGPEGGFTPEEDAELRAVGIRPLNLGEWVLRLETAALCGLAVLRKFMSALVLVGVAAFLCGGCGREAARHPLVRKGDYCRDIGDAKAALNFYRRALEKYPNSPVLFMKLAMLHDESLNDPLAAAWYYSEYLRVAPDSPERETVEACRRAALERLRQMDENTIRQTAETEKLRLRVRQLETERRRLIRAAQDAATRETPQEAPAGKKPGEKARR
jgi:16S rRNA (uracil1498-N3)-methyltransferase